MKKFLAIMKTILLGVSLMLLPIGNAFCETVQSGEPPGNAEKERIPVSVLILPKFEVGEMAGDFPGEAQYYYENYLVDAATYEIPGGTDGSVLYYKNGIALYVTGMGKVTAALSTMAVLSDERFDFSQAYILSTGCAGSSAGTSVMGDVFVITAAVDYDLGHHADIREMTEDTAVTWFHDPDFDDTAVVKLNPELMDKVWNLTKDISVETTEVTRKYMSAAFDGAEWAVRDPKVQRGTTVTGDNYWKGQYDHANALQMVQVYDCPDPYATAEMEEIAVALAVRRMGMLDRLIIIRGSVNMDVFMLGATPENLWNPDESALHLASESNVEAADIFITAMKNIYAAGRVIIDAIQNGEMEKVSPDIMAEIKDRGVLRIGTAGDYMPMSYLDPKTNRYVGFDVELAEDLAASLGVEIEYVPTSWPTLMEDTLAGKFDLAVCGITITEARKEQALMSDGYLENGKTVLCRAEDAEKYTSLEAINNPEVRVMENPGGLNEKFAREHLPEATLIIHEVNQEIPGLVAAGEADVMITEVMEAGYYIGQDDRLAAPLIHEPFTQGQLGFLMPKGSEALLEYVNAFIQQEKESGRIDDLADQYIYNADSSEKDAA